jgi:hypothetical protein
LRTTLSVLAQLRVSSGGVVFSTTEMAAEKGDQGRN